MSNKVRKYSKKRNKRNNKYRKRNLKNKRKYSKRLNISGGGQICGIDIDILKMYNIKMLCGNYTLPNIINFSCTPYMLENMSILPENNIDIITIPKGTLLYKAGKWPNVQTDVELKRIINQTSVSNWFAHQSSWLSYYEAAVDYATSAWGKREGYKVVSFRLTKPVKMFFLYSKNNLDKLYNLLEKDLQESKDKIVKSQSVNETVFYFNKLNELQMKLDIMKLTTGINTDFATQLKLCKKWGNIITNDPTYDVDKEIDKRITDFWGGCNPNKMFFEKDGKPAILNFNNFCTVGPREEDLTRVSFNTNLDKVMISTICEYYNVDGYSAPALPTVFHKDNKLDEELAFIMPRDVIEVVGWAPPTQLTPEPSPRTSPRVPRRVTSF
jgi:hypothetical protein